MKLTLGSISIFRIQYYIAQGFPGTFYSYLPSLVRQLLIDPLTKFQKSNARFVHLMRCEGVMHTRWTSKFEALLEISCWQR